MDGWMRAWELYPDLGRRIKIILGFFASVTLHTEIPLYDFYLFTTYFCNYILKELTYIL